MSRAEKILLFLVLNNVLTRGMRDDLGLRGQYDQYALWDVLRKTVDQLGVDLRLHAGGTFLELIASALVSLDVPLEGDLTKANRLLRESQTSTFQLPDRP